MSRRIDLIRGRINLLFLLLFMVLFVAGLAWGVGVLGNNSQDIKEILQ